jgi:hypothetical protein
MHEKLLSKFVHKFVYISVSEHFSFAKKIHPPDRCGMIKQHDNYTAASCAGDNKTNLQSPGLSHNTMPQMTQVLREHAIVMLTAGMSPKLLPVN